MHTSDVLLIAVLVAAVVAIWLLVVVLGRLKSGSVEKALRDELREGRRESQQASRHLREELSGGLKAGNETVFCFFYIFLFLSVKNQKDIVFVKKLALKKCQNGDI